MSSDIIEELDDNKGNTISLSMKASGFAWLSISGQGDECFCLTPDQEGINLAKQIENGLQAWRKQMEEIICSECGVVISND